MKLTDRPNPEHIKKNPEGYDYIPIGLVEDVLDTLDMHWQTNNCNFFITPIGDNFLATAIIDLTFTYEGKIKRVTGAHSMFLHENGTNTNYSASCISYAVVNAAKQTGLLFGRDFNERNERVVSDQQQLEKELDDKRDELAIMRDKLIYLKEKTNSKPSKNK